GFPARPERKKRAVPSFFCFADAPDWTAIAFSIQAVCCYCKLLMPVFLRRFLDFENDRDMTNRRKFR
ncbi:hypothetical protein ACC718_39030, partial [Rhizobium ruizarguesonis]